MTKIKPEWTTAVFTALIAIVTTVYTIFTYNLWSVAVAQLRSTERTSKQQLRAWVGVKTLQLIRDPNGTPYSNIVFHNFGSSPALDLNFHAQGGIFYSSLPNALNIVGKQLAILKRTENQGALAQGDELGQREPVNLTPLQVGDIERRKAIYLFWGRIMYEDIFRDTHTTTFCGWFEATKPDTMRSCGRFGAME